MTAIISSGDSDDLHIPLIDFSEFLHGDPLARQSCATALLHGFTNMGFVYLLNHGIPYATMDRVFEFSASFFSLPQATKDSISWTTAEVNRGYLSCGREKATNFVSDSDVEALRAAAPDLKESLEIGREGPDQRLNQWPKIGDWERAHAFKDTMVEFFNTCNELHMQVMRAIALGLHIEESWFDGFISRGDNVLRLLHYPSVKVEVFRKNKLQVRAGEHTDFGSVSLLFQDSRGGLQVCSPSGMFVNVVPIPNTIVVNAGDLLSRWSNDLIKSTIHRVVEPPQPPGKGIPADDEEYPPRYSVAYFCNPNPDSVIDAIPGTFGETNEKKYNAVISGEYIKQRLSSIY